MFFNQQNGAKRIFPFFLEFENTFLLPFLVLGDYLSTSRRSRGVG